MPDRFQKRIRIKEWDYSQSAIYMVTVCIADRTYRLGAISEQDTVDLNDAGRMVVQEIEAIESRDQRVKVDDYVVMPNHVHLLVGLDLGLDEKNPMSLRRVMGEWKSRTTNRYIKGVKMGLLPSFDRHLWQVDYYETIMRNAEWVERRREYIANNPANWRNDTEMLR